MKIGFIGFGRLGSHLCKFLSQDFDIFVFDKKGLEDEIQARGANVASLDEVCQCQVVIPFVPISEFENLMQEIGPKLTSNQLLIDVCSVKEHPVELMKKYTSPEVSLMGTHPMFGPDSTKETLFGSKIVLCNVRLEDLRFKEIVCYLEKHGLKVIQATPQEHDEQISHSLVLTHLIGRTLIEYGAQKTLDIDTLGYRRLMKILGVVENDTWQLFEDMNSYNRFSSQTREEFSKALEAIIKKVEN